MIDWFQTFNQFKPFKPLPLTSPAARGRLKRDGTKRGV